MGKPFDAVLKGAFLAAVKFHLAKGWTVNSAYQQAKADFQQEGKPVPDRAVVYRWLRQKGVFPRTRRTGRTGRTNAGTEAAEPETDDYVRKLEAMLRLYRRRTEADVDAVCDCLLPGLLEEGE